MPLIAAGLLALAMTLAVAKNDQARREALQKEHQQMLQQHEGIHEPRTVGSGQKLPGG
jgi:hypothetical protein